MSKPPRRVPTWYNGWRVRRELAAEAEEVRQVAAVVDALDELEARSHPALPVPILPPTLPAHAPASPQGTEATMAVETPPAMPAPASARTGAQTSAPDAYDHPPLPAPEVPPDRGPTGPGSPAARPLRASKRQRGLGNRPRILRVLPENANAEQRIRALLKAYPTMSVRTLAKRAHVAESTASKWRGIIAAENAAGSSDRQTAAAAQ